MKDLPTRMQVAMAHSDGGEPSSYLLDPAVNFVLGGEGPLLGTRLRQ